MTGKQAESIAQRCQPKVFDLEDIGGAVFACTSSLNSIAGEKHLRVARPFGCTMCRECIRDPKDREKVKLMRIRDHFIFSIESTGAMKPAVLFERAVEVLKTKCSTTLSRLQEIVDTTSAAPAEL